MKKLTTILLVVMLSIILVSFGYEKDVKIVPIFVGSIKRSEVNSIIETNVKFYTEEYSKKENINTAIAETIIMKALTSNVPINLAFALAESESSYNPTATNTNSDGSYDFGLYQLNSSTFGDVKKNYKDINKNANAALIYLQEMYAVYGSYDLALIAYNCGKVRRFNDLTQAHLKNILSREEELDKWFNSKYRDTLSRSIN